MNDKCTVLINSCDAYSDVWDLFFTALKGAWEDFDYPIVLNTQSNEYNFEGVRVINHKKRKDDRWGERYRDTLRKIDSPYVLPILDDFVLRENTRPNKLINDVIEWMEDNKEIDVFYLNNHPHVNKIPTEYPKFGLLPRKCDYKLTTDIAVWRKESLYNYIKDFETPWEWEMYATKKAWKSNKKFYALLDKKDAPFSITYGGVIRRGLWHPEVVQIAEKYDVKIDFSERGFMDESNPFKSNDFYSIKEHFPKDVFKIKFWTTLVIRLRQVIREIRCSI